jgi:hypothetical protein
MRYKKEIGQHLARVIKELVETERTTGAVKKPKEITNPGAYAVVEEAKRFQGGCRL